MDLKFKLLIAFSLVGILLIVGLIILSTPSEVGEVIMNPSPGTFEGYALVSLSSSTVGATIYYTLDGSVPDKTSNVYAEPINISSDDILHAIALKDGLLPSKISSGIYLVTSPAGLGNEAIVTARVDSGSNFVGSGKGSGGGGGGGSSGSGGSGSTNQNIPPIVSISSPSNGITLSPGSNFSVEVSASDPDGTISKVELYRNGIIFMNDTTSPYSFSIKDIQTGNYTFSAKAIDNSGAETTSATITVLVSPGGPVQNILPNVIITYPSNGQSLYTGSSVIINASANDSDGTISKVEFYLNGVSIANDTTFPYQALWLTPSIGSHVLTAKAVDNNGSSTTSGTVSVTVSLPPANIPPSVSITAPSNGASFTNGSTISITATASDSDGTISRVEFLRNGVSIRNDSSFPYSYSWTNAQVGNYTLTARAYDNNGSSTTSSGVVVNVNPPVQNVPPSVSISSPTTGSSFTTGSTISITATASDSDGTISRVEFLRNGVSINNDTSFPYSYSWTNAQVGSYTLTAKAYDNNGSSTTSSGVVVAVNQSSQNNPPSIFITSPPNGATFTIGDTINVGASANDSDGTITRVEFLRNGVSINNDTSFPYSYSWTNAQVGNYILIARAYDNSGASSDSSVVGVSVLIPSSSNLSGWSYTPGLYGVTSLCNNGVQDDYEEGVDKGGACGYNYPEDLPNPLPAGVDVFYISDTDGNDNNDGRSPSTPWKTLLKLHNSWNLIGPGDYVLFKRGDTWRPTTGLPGGASGGGIIQPPAGKSGSPNAYITLGAYGTGAKPIISARDAPSYAGIQNIMYTQNGGMHYFKFQDLEFRGYFIMRSDNSFGSLSSAANYTNLKFHRLLFNWNVPGDYNRGSFGIEAKSQMPADGNPEGYWPLAQVHDIEIAYSTFNNSGGADTIGLGGQGNFYIHHNEVYNSRSTTAGNEGDSIDFGMGNNIRVEYNIISGSYGYNLKIQKHGHWLDYCSVKGNLMMGSGTSNGVIVGDGSAINAIGTRFCTIEDNTFVAYGQWGSAIFDGFVNPVFAPDTMEEHGFYGNTIKNNLFYGTHVVMTVLGEMYVTYRNGSTINYDYDPIWISNNFINNTYYANGDEVMYYRTYTLPSGMEWVGNDRPENAGYNQVGWQYGAYVINPGSSFNSQWLSGHSNIVGDRAENPQLINPYWTNSYTYGNYRVQNTSPSYGRGAWAAVDGGSVSVIQGECTPGQTQSCSTGQSGICSAGTITCTFSGQWSSCVAPTPQTEICGNGIDEDCNGQDSICAIQNQSLYLAEQTVEAEWGNLSGGMLSGTGNGETYVYSPSGTSTGGWTGSATYRFNITQAGTYKLEVRVLGADGSSDSFFVGVDGANNVGNDNFIYDLIQGTSFVWDEVNLRGPGGTNENPVYNPATWNFSVGTHTITFYGREANAQIDKLNLRLVSLSSSGGSNVPPSVSISSPTTGSSFTTGSTISITATASDSDGTISRVEFLRNGVSINNDTSFPYSYSWTNAQVGSYTLTAKAYDNNGSSTTSSGVVINVNIPVSSFDKIVLLGDSNTAIDWPLQNSEKWPERVASGLGVEVVNLGVGGWTTTSFLTPSSMSQWKAQNGDYYILTFGLNDLLYDTPQEFEDNTRQLIAEVQSINAIPVLMTNVYLDPNHWNDWAGYPPAIVEYDNIKRDLATELNIPLIDPYTRIVSETSRNNWDVRIRKVRDPYVIDNSQDHLQTGNPNWFDDLHYNSNGCAMVADEIVSYFSNTTRNFLPNVSITGPTMGSSFNSGSTISISASAFDSDGTISRVEFLRNGVSINNDTSFPYSYSWTNSQVGSYLLSAKAYDNRGGSMGSTLVLVNVTQAAQNNPPSIVIISPPNGATYSNGDTVTINASATDSDGTIARVEFLRNGTSIGNDTTYPYSYSWASVPTGVYSLTTKAYDNNGASTTSSAVVVNVVAPIMICGNGFCDANESCSTCSNDCGSCPVLASGWEYTPGLYGITSFCTNGVKDTFEEGVDCGGACDACAIPAGKTVYYVSSSSGSDSYDGKAPSWNGTSGPWQTLNKVQSSWSLINGPGRYLLFKRGDSWTSGGGSESMLQPNVNLIGAAGNPIVIGAYGTGNKPIISHSSKYGFYTIGANVQYLTLQDIHFVGSLDFWAYNGHMHHVKVLRVVSEGGYNHAGITFFRNPTNEPAPETWTFEGNGQISDIEIGYSKVVGSNPDSIGIYGTNNLWVHHNEAYSSGEDNIDLQGNNITMEYNLVSEASATGIKIMPHYNGGINNTIRGNLILNSGYAAGLNFPNSKNTKIYDNTVAVTDFSAILGWQDLNPLASTDAGTRGSFDNTEFYNNILVGVVYLGFADDIDITYKNGATRPNYHQTSPWVGGFFRDNFHDTSAGSGFIYVSAYTGSAVWGGCTICYSFPGLNRNAYYMSLSTWNNYPNVENSVVGNPGFVNPTWTSAQNFGNFRIQPGSAAYGKGAYAAVDN